MTRGRPAPGGRWLFIAGLLVFVTASMCWHLAPGAASPNPIAATAPLSFSHWPAPLRSSLVVVLRAAWNSDCRTTMSETCRSLAPLLVELLGSLGEDDAAREVGAWADRSSRIADALSADLYERLSEIELWTGHNGPGLKHARRALAIRRRDPGAADAVTRAQARVARALQLSAAYGQVRPMIAGLRQAAADPRTLPDTAAEAFEILGNQRWFDGDVAAAGSAYLEGATLTLEKLGAEHPRTIRLLRKSAEAQYESGELSLGSLLASRALLLATAQLGLDHPDVDGYFIAAGDALVLQGRYSEGRRAYEQALELARRAGNYSSAATILHNLAVADTKLGDVALALARQREAVSLWRQYLGPAHPYPAYGLSAIAQILLDRGELAPALALLDEASALRVETNGPEDPMLVPIASMIGTAAWRSNQVALADRAMATAMTALSRHASIRPADSIQILRELAAYFDWRGEAARAEQTLERAIARANGQFGAGHPLHVDTLIDLAVWRFDHDKVAAGFDTAETAIALLQPSFDRELGELPPLELVKFAAQRRRLEAALASAAVGRAPALAWRALQATIDRRATALAEAGRRRDAAPRPRVTPRDLIPHLGANDRLVSFVRSDADTHDRRGKQAEAAYLAFVLDGAGQLDVRPLGSAPAIDAAVHEWRQRLPDRGPFQDAAYRAVAARLRELIWDPVVPSSAATVWVVPDGTIWDVAFDALIASDGRYLIESARVRYLPAERYLGTTTPGGTPTGLLVVGDVDFGAPDLAALAACAGQGLAFFRPLPATRAELTAVERAWHMHGGGATTVLRQNDAAETAVRAAVSGRRVLHFATHAYQPAACPPGTTTPGASSHAGLALAGANTWESDRDFANDGRLTVPEVAALQLSDTELVVLSACDSARGPLAGSEGPLSLAWSFQVAGARQVLAAVWAIPDKETQEWITTFYMHWLERRLPIAEAARQAALAQLHAERTQPGRTPLSWAALLLSGAN